MNPEQLLQHFDRISEAPDAIPRLRRFILDLAVRGKLVEQDPNDEPASELLKRISKLNGKSLSLFVRQPEDYPFQLPKGWVWSEVSLVTTKTGSGSTPRGGQAVYQSEGIPFLRSQNIYNDGLRLHDVAYIDANTHSRMDGTAVKPCDLLLNITGGSIGRCCLVPDEPIDANISQHVAIIRLAIPEMSVFSHKLVLSPFFQSYVIDEQTGAGRGGLPKNRMDKIPFPLPPLAEQHRIVAKVDELMALCDQLQAAQTEREQSRDRLVAASLHRLNQPADDEATNIPEAQREHARFIFNHLPRLTARPEHIKQLRQTILNLAVRGKLVLQDPNDEPALDLLKRIQAKKNILIKEGKLRKTKSLASVADEDFEFEKPLGWIGSRLGDIYDVRDGTHDTPKYVDSGYPLITSKNLSSGKLSFDDIKFISEQDHRQISERSLVEKDDILLAMIGSIGNPIIVDTDREFSIKNVALFKYYDKSDAYPGFLRIYLKHAALKMQELAAGGLQPFVSLGFLRSYPIALPPLSEQHRIVAKVDELMALCDQLEDRLADTAADSRRLLEAVLHEALLPVGQAA